MMPVKNFSDTYLFQLIVSLAWKNVIVLHDERVSPTFFFNLEDNAISYTNYDISTATDTELLTILMNTGNVTGPVRNILLICDGGLIIKVLKQIEVHDNLDTPVDYRHSSRMVAITDSHGMSLAGYKDTLIENVAAVDLQKIPGAGIYALMFTPSGRAFHCVGAKSLFNLKEEDIFPNLRYGYNGRLLRVVIKKYGFSSGGVVVHNHIISGWSLLLLDALSESLNFTYRVIPPREDQWGRNHNGSWTGLIGMLQRRDADLLATPLVIHNDRKHVVDYILPRVRQNSLMLLYRRDTTEDTLAVFTRPFSLYVFVAFFGVLLTYVALLSLVRFVDAKHQSDITGDSRGASYAMRAKNALAAKGMRSSFTSQMSIIGVSLFETLGASLRQGVHKVVSRSSERLLVSSWWGFTIIISAVYCSAILAAFTVKKEIKPFSTFDELALRTDYKVGYDLSSVIGNQLKNSKDAGVIAVRNRVFTLSAQDKDVFTSNESIHLENVRQGKYVFVTGYRASLYMSHTNCRWEATDTKLESGFSAFAVPKRSPYYKEIQRSMHKMSDSGVLARIKQKWLNSIPEGKCPMEPFPKAISFSQIHSILYPVAAGVALALIVLLLEMLQRMTDILKC